MKAALCTSLDGPQSLVLGEIPAPADVPAGQALVRVTAVGLNFADTLITRGKYQFKPELPFSPGAELAGVVEQAGAGVAVRPGTRVMAYVNWGGAREQALVPADALIDIPDAVDDVVAAGLSVTYGTAMHGLKDRGRFQAGETVVVTGAAGGAGHAAVELAKLMDARVIAVVSSADKAALAQAAGADAVTLASGPALKDAVRDLSCGRGADIVYDCVGGDSAEALVRALAWEGRFLVVGFASGEIPKLPLNLLLLKGAEASGVFWGDFVRRAPQRQAANMRQVLQWVAEGRLKPRTHATYPLANIVDALGVIDRREALGKVVLTI